MPFDTTEVSLDRFHSGKFMPWAEVWLKEQEPSLLTPRFSTVFRQDDSIMQHASVAGWKLAMPGVIAVDVDRDDLEVARLDMIKVLDRLAQAGASPCNWRLFLSGGKGFHLQFLASSWGQPLLDCPGAMGLPAHERAVMLALLGICGEARHDAGLRESIRLFRVPNSLYRKPRPGDPPRFKVPLSQEELRSLPLPALLSLGSTPRGLSTVPEGKLDEALAALFNEAKMADDLLASQDKKKAARRARQWGEAAQFTSSQGLMVPDGRRTILMARINDLLPRRPYLRSAWDGIPWAGRNNSDSEFDFRLCKELLILGWGQQDVLHAMLMRGSGPGQKNPLYYQRTIERATHSANKVRQRPLLETMSGDDWIESSPIWLPRHGLGQTAHVLFNAHLRTLASLGWDKRPGTWSPCYYLASGDLHADFNEGKGRIATKQTVRRLHELLKCVRLIKLVRQGQGKQASQYKLRIPLVMEEPGLIKAALAAKQVMGSRKSLKLETRREARRAADLALKANETPHIQPDMNSSPPLLPMNSSSLVPSGCQSIVR